MEGKFCINFEGTPFLVTSKIHALANRLNWRAEMLLTRNPTAIKDKKILDLGSHDGRFSWACLELGASHVTGVEARPHLVKFANENLIGLGYGLQSFTFVEGDVFDYLPTVELGEFDTILCLGFFYHTARQIELMNEVKRIEPEFFILDTAVATEVSKLGNINRIIRKAIRQARLKHLIQINKYPRYLRSVDEKPEGRTRMARGGGHLVFTYKGHGKEERTLGAAGLVATPTKSLIETLFESYGFEFEQLHWNREDIRDWTELRGYKTGARVSYLARLS